MWFAREYDPIQVGSIDGTDTTPHDRALLRAITSRYHPPGKTRPELTRDPLKTLFVGRLDPETTEDKLRDAFISFGDIINAVIVSNFVTGDSRGYGFVEFSSETDCEKAYRRSQHLSIDGRTVIVDYERGRIMEGWRPRRVGGGFGGRKESSQLRFGARDRPFRQPM
ncbi:hypothetical protein BDF22DRAFT_652210 [Syncephalis plumigaleata]|nr:hypothetical protein BDF22DRAFT_652210 [Syncephalis plumigaleata]